MMQTRLLNRVRQDIECVIRSVALSVLLLLCSGLSTFGDSKPEAFDLYRAGKYDEAAAMFRRLSAQIPDDSQVWFLLGRSEMNRGDFKAAEKAFRRHLELQPGSVEGRYSLAQTLAKMGQPVEAQKLFQSIRGEHPDVERQLALLSTSNQDDLSNKGGKTSTVNSKPKRTGSFGNNRLWACLLILFVGMVIAFVIMILRRLRMPRYMPISNSGRRGYRSRLKPMDISRPNQRKRRPVVQPARGSSGRLPGRSAGQPSGQYEPEGIPAHASRDDRTTGHKWPSGTREKEPEPQIPVSEGAQSAQPSGMLTGTNGEKGRPVGPRQRRAVQDPASVDGAEPIKSQGEQVTSKDASRQLESRSQVEQPELKQPASAAHSPESQEVDNSAERKPTVEPVEGPSKPEIKGPDQKDGHQRQDVPEHSGTSQPNGTSQLESEPAQPPAGEPTPEQIPPADKPEIKGPGQKDQAHGQPHQEATDEDAHESKPPRQLEEVSAGVSPDQRGNKTATSTEPSAPPNSDHGEADISQGKKSDKVPGFARQVPGAGQESLSITFISVAPDESRLAFIIGPTKSIEANNEAQPLWGVYIVSHVSRVRQFLRWLGLSRHCGHKLPKQLDPNNANHVYHGLCSNPCWSPDGRNLAFETVQTTGNDAQASITVVFRNITTENSFEDMNIRENIASPSWIDNQTLAAIHVWRSLQSGRVPTFFTYRDQLAVVPLGETPHLLALPIPVPVFNRMIFDRQRRVYVFLAYGLRVKPDVLEEPHQLHVVRTLAESSGSRLSQDNQRQPQSERLRRMGAMSRLLRRKLSHGKFFQKRCLTPACETLVVPEFILPFSNDYAIRWFGLACLRNVCLDSPTFAASRDQEGVLSSESFLVQLNKEGNQAVAYEIAYQKQMEAIDNDTTQGVCTCADILPQTSRVFYMKGNRLLVGIVRVGR